MPRLTRIYTGKGDEGTTGLIGGQRVPKDSPRVAAYGSVDELNSHIGLALSLGVSDELTPALKAVQNDLFHLGSDLATLEPDKQRLKIPQIEQRHVDALEQLMDRLTGQLGPLDNFILPGGSTTAAALHVARAVCRRAERDAIALSRVEPIGAFVVKYLNRLSDALFVVARYENHARGVSDIYWNSRA
ncbi:MAG TPA: cob(I)yrinic acid a,c-diamide adenosyltransferase [Anaerolineae bacterium]